MPADDGATFKWTETGHLNSTRNVFASALLPDGKVLVTGGYEGSTDLNTTELYDPGQGIFSPAAPMAQSRSNHTATRLCNGKILVVGGQAGGRTLSSAELYDPATGMWSPTGNLHFARAYHTATLLPNNQVLVTGGVSMAAPPVFAQGAPMGSALDAAELYDPSTRKWTATGSMHDARYTHTATLLDNGDVLVTGGMDSRMTADPALDEIRVRTPSCVPAISSAEVFHCKTGTWSETGSLIDARFNHTATLLPNGDVLIVAGQSDGIHRKSAELYHPDSGTWVATGSLRTSRNGQTATLLPDGRVYVVGGANETGVLTDTEIYDPTTRKWEAGAPLNTPHSQQTATLLSNGKLLVMGGGYAVGLPSYTQGSAELCDIATVSSSPDGTTPAPRPGLD